MATNERCSHTELGLKCSSSHLNEVVGEEAPFPVEVPLHPAILLYVPHVLDDVAQLEGQLVVMERFVLILHHNLYSTQDEWRGWGVFEREYKWGGRERARERQQELRESGGRKRHKHRGVQRWENHLWEEQTGGSERGGGGGGDTKKGTAISKTSK